MKRITILVLVGVLLSSALGTFAHGGRTDKYGGHRDKNNISGLRYYHFHCGGHPAHLHNNNICQYTIKPQPKKNIPIYIIDAPLSLHLKNLHIPNAILNITNVDILSSMFQLT